LKKVAHFECIQLTNELAERICEKSQRNLRRALLMLQTCTTQFNRLPLSKDQEVLEPDWQIYLRETARMIATQHTPQR